MTKEEAAKYVKEWVKYVEDPDAIPVVDQPCTGEEIIEAMKICADALSNSEPQELDEAAEETYPDEKVVLARGNTCLSCGNVKRDAFKAGAKWMAEQGVTIEGFITGCDDHISFDSEDYLPEGSPFEDMERVIIQIRKKED